jgi:cell cycle checkpoint protein
MFGCLISSTVTAMAFINADIFDEYTYTPSPSSRTNRHLHRSRSSSSPPSSQTENSDEDKDEDKDEEPSVAFEIPLNTLIDCLNIFGTAGSFSTSSASSSSNKKRWRRADDDDDGGFGEEREARRGPIDNYFSGGKDEKRTGMRMSFAGAGYPLILLMWVPSSPVHPFVFRFMILPRCLFPRDSDIPPAK